MDYHLINISDIFIDTLWSF